ncbi:HD domain-containing phosphohydrolase [Pelagibius sp. CAU 1746]|uniref:HD-GYP domain-containing protein n=1 Tax=Pelagibius sp. CAU 1746 TaxID=3140370 RepID=UPI00325B5697
MCSASAPAESDFISTEVDPNQFKPTRSRALSRGLTVIGIILAICVVVPIVLIQLRQGDLESELQRRLEVLSAGRAEVIETWLSGSVRPAGRVLDSELFRLFATEMDFSGGDISGPGAGAPAGGDAFSATLSEQLPYMEQILTDFADNAGFAAGYVINREGISYVSTAGALLMSGQQQQIARGIFDSGTIAFGPARRAPGGAVIDFFAPIFAAQFELTGGQYPEDPGELRQLLAEQTVGVLMLTIPIDEMLIEVLAPPPLSGAGERLVLLQRSDGGLFLVDPNTLPPVRLVEGIDMPPADAPLPFAERGAVGRGTAVYSAGSPVRETAWWVVQEIETAVAENQMRGFVLAVLAVAGLVMLAVIAAFGAFWWRLNNEHSSTLADQFKRLASRIEAQRRFLDSVNNSIAEYIGVKSKEGRYRYLNPAFARAVDRSVGDAVGLDDAALFGQGTAERLARSDRRVLEREASVTFNTEIYLQSRLHHLQVSKVPYHDDSGETVGIVSVMRDVTELVEEHQKRERAMQQMVSSLVRAVELRDPYLAGHSRRLAGFARAVAELLEAGSEVVATVEIAANLSQIGKLAVPVEILTKPGRLSDSEIEQLQRHIQHTASILRDIDFELPVLDAVTQMHERLDGGGYPNGLSGEQIGLAGRILGACDVFCARLEPRVYRGGISPERALQILEQNDRRYDARVIAALRRVAESIAGEKLIADLAGD